MSNIDADALERAAKAARQVEKSKYAREIFKMSREESVTKQQEERTKQEEAKAQVRFAAWLAGWAGQGTHALISQCS